MKANITNLRKAFMKVAVLDYTIAEVESTRAASMATGLMRESISHACHGKSKTAGGYIWKFKTN